MTLREGKEQAQPGELPEGDDDRFKPVGGGRKTLGQMLVRTIPKGTKIDTSSSTEHTE